MFLAVKEIRHEKLRYGLIIGMIVLIGYLMFIDGHDAGAG